MYGMMIDIIPTPLCDLKVMDLESLCKIFRTSLFPNPLMDLVYACYMYEDIDRSNVLHSTTPTSQGQGHRLRFFLC